MTSSPQFAWDAPQISTERSTSMKSLVPGQTEAAGSSTHLTIMDASKCISEGKDTATALCPQGREKAILANRSQTENIKRDAFAAYEFGCPTRNSEQRWLPHTRRLFFFQLPARAHPVQS